MAFGAQDVQSADADHPLVLGVRVFLVSIENLVPLFCGALEFRAVVVKDDALGAILLEHHLASSGAQGLRNSLFYSLLAGHKFRVAAQQNIGAPSGHIGGDSDGPET